MEKITRHGGKFKGIFTLEVYGRGIKLFGKTIPLGRPLSTTKTENIITDEGLNHILNVVLHDTAKKATWYCECFEDDYTPDGDETYAVPEYTEWEAYDEATRPEYDNAASSAESTTNSGAKAVFTANATKTLYGASLVSVNTKGDEAGGGILICLGTFAVAQPVINTNVVNLTYTVTAADDGV